MFGWFQSRRQAACVERQLTPETARALVCALGELVEKHGCNVVDISRLPASKTVLVQALKAAWLSTADEDFRGSIEGVWVCLASFQAGVGPRPVSGDITGLSMGDALARMQAYAKWGPLVLAEMKALAADVELFKVRVSNQPGA